MVVAALLKPIALSPLRFLWKEGEGAVAEGPSNLKDEKRVVRWYDYDGSEWDDYHHYQKDLLAYDYQSMKMKDHLFSWGNQKLGWDAFINMFQFLFVFFVGPFLRQKKCQKIHQFLLSGSLDFHKDNRKRPWDRFGERILNVGDFFLGIGPRAQWRSLPGFYKHGVCLENMTVTKQQTNKPTKCNWQLHLLTIGSSIIWSHSACCFYQATIRSKAFEGNVGVIASFCHSTLVA